MGLSCPGVQDPKITLLLALATSIRSQLPNKGMHTHEKNQKQKKRMENQQTKEGRTEQDNGQNQSCLPGPSNIDPEA